MKISTIIPTYNKENNILNKKEEIDKKEELTSLELLKLKIDSGLYKVDVDKIAEKLSNEIFNK